MLQSTDRRSKIILSIFRSTTAHQEGIEQQQLEAGNIMPGGKVHSAATLVTAGMTAPILYYRVVPTSEIALMTAGMLATLVINPDLDLNRKRPRGIAVVWWLFWWPYSKMVGHRSPISHFPIMGTIIRIIYILIPAIVILHKVAPGWVPGLLIFTSGMIVSDTVHFVLDILSTGYKRFRTRIRKALWNTYSSARRAAKRL
jgi:uncharacterized metal-binding protein